MNSRYISAAVNQLALSRRKMAFVSGPRQVGKTTFAKAMASNHSLTAAINERPVHYCNWDEKNFRRNWTKNPSSILLNSEVSDQFLILDEIHKAKLWKRDLKGLYDVHGDHVRILVTGSARLNVFKKGGDSLLGRYFPFRLHPFSMGEILAPGTQSNPVECLDRLFQTSEASSNDQYKLFERLFKYGGFPEPFMQENEQFLNLWHQERLEKIIREDLRDLSRIPELSQLEMLASLLPERVSSLLSIASLRVDLEVAFNTVKRWMQSLEQLYYFYVIRPFSKGVARSLKKEPKIYLWDWSEVEDQSIRFENMVASTLLKACHFWTDTGYGLHELYFLRNKEKVEVDFLVTKKQKPILSVEVKFSEEAISKSFLVFAKDIGIKRHIQILHKPGVWITRKIDDIEVIVASADLVFPHFP